MNIISRFINRFRKDDIKVLGRWNIDYCNNKMNYKIDLSNEDHCGPCGQYILNKKSLNNKNINININNDNTIIVKE